MRGIGLQLSQKALGDEACFATFQFGPSIPYSMLLLHYNWGLQCEDDEEGIQFIKSNIEKAY